MTDPTHKKDELAAKNEERVKALCPDSTRFYNTVMVVLDGVAAELEFERCGGHAKLEDAIACSEQNRAPNREWFICHRKVNPHAEFFGVIIRLTGSVIEVNDGC